MLQCNLNNYFVIGCTCTVLKYITTMYIKVAFPHGFSENKTECNFQLKQEAVMIYTVYTCTVKVF